MKYSKKLADRICELVATGDHTVEDVCKQVGISESIFYKWKSEKLEFLESLKKAQDTRLDSFAKMAKSGLAKLLDIYEFEEVTTEWVEGKDGKPKIKFQKKVKKAIMPNAAAVIFTLTNRDPENWKNKQEVSGTNINYNVPVSRDEIKEISEELEKEV